MSREAILIARGRRESEQEIAALRAALVGLVVEFSGRIYDGHGNVMYYQGSVPALFRAFEVLRLPNPCPVGELPER